MAEDIRDTSNGNLTDATQNNPFTIRNSTTFNLSVIDARVASAADDGLILDATPNRGDVILAISAVGRTAASLTFEVLVGTAIFNVTDNSEGSFTLCWPNIQVQGLDGNVVGGGPHGLVA